MRHSFTTHKTVTITCNACNDYFAYGNKHLDLFPSPGLEPIICGLQARRQNNSATVACYM